MTELTNRNDAHWITAINLFNNLPRNAQYCASGYIYCHLVNGARLPIHPVAIGRVAAYFRDPAKIIYRKNQRGNQRLGPRPQLMDAVSLYESHIEGLAQPHFDPDSDDRVKLLGFNTTSGKGTKGGCYINVRRASEIKLIANWLTPYLATVKR